MKVNIIRKYQIYHAFFSIVFFLFPCVFCFYVWIQDSQHVVLVSSAVQSRCKMFVDSKAVLSGFEVLLWKHCSIVECKVLY